MSRYTDLIDVSTRVLVTVFYYTQLTQSDLVYLLRMIWTNNILLLNITTINFTHYLCYKNVLQFTYIICMYFYIQIVTIVHICAFRNIFNCGSFMVKLVNELIWGVHLPISFVLLLLEIGNNEYHNCVISPLKIHSPFIDSRVFWDNAEYHLISAKYFYTVLYNIIVKIIRAPAIYK